MSLFHHQMDAYGTQWENTCFNLIVNKWIDNTIPILDTVLNSDQVWGFKQTTVDSWNSGTHNSGIDIGLKKLTS